MYRKRLLQTLCLFSVMLPATISRAQEKSGTHDTTTVQSDERARDKGKTTGASAGQPDTRKQPKNDWENPLQPSLNTIAPHASFIPYPDSRQALQGGESPFTLSLDGVWKFDIVQNPAQRPARFFTDTFNTSGWKDIHVPANIQVEGYDRFIFTDVEYPIPPNPPYVPADYNPVGSYKRSFNLPNNWKDKKIFIHLGAVNSFFYLWINGHYAGFSKDSKTPAEFDISSMLRPGSNTVSVQVFRFSDGTYLEGQDMWKLSGIERSVYLIARPQLSIKDFFARAGLDSLYEDGLLDLKITLDHLPKTEEQGDGLAIRVSLLDDADHNKVVYQNKELIKDRQTFQFNTRILHVRKWNAEQPNLYTLLIEQLDKHGRTIEAIVHHPGFRNIEIRHGLFLVNGVAIKIKGVNRHEHDMITGKAISVASMITDIRLFKLYNINAMRCSHYPNREEWYELCDKYGIYLIDEVNLECDGMSMLPSVYTLSDKPDWKTAYMDRTRRMWERDKNHCSIVTWSLGNESRWGDNLQDDYTWLKSVDNTRPVQYEEARDNPYTDIICPMYKSLYVMQDYVREWKPRPMIQVEYAHMMGNSGGNLKDDWDLMYKYPQLQGGFIWDFCDQTFKRKDKNGRWFWAYGRDMGQVGLTSDTSFCADGMFAGDRTPHPQAFEMRKVYQNVGFSPLAFTTSRISVINRFDFTDLNQYGFRWYIKANGQRIAGGDLQRFSLAPHAATELDIPLPAIDVQPGVEYFMYVEALTTKEAPLVPAGTVIAWEQWELPWTKTAANGKGASATLNDAGASATSNDAGVSATAKDAGASAASPGSSLQKKENQDQLTVYDNSFSVAFDKHSGWLTQFAIHGLDLLKSPLQPDFTRAATDNDIGNSQQIRCVAWEHAMEGARLDSFSVRTEGLSQMIVSAAYYLPVVNARYWVEYGVKAGGEVAIRISMKAGNGDQPELPRFGLALIMKAPYENVSWFGRGPFDNYQDRNYAAAVDLYSMKADSLFHPYARAQESGYRTDIRWMSLLNAGHVGLKAMGAPLFSAGVLHFDRSRMDFDRDAPENKHGGSMSNDDLIRWNIDYKQEGVGADNAWGAQTHSEYTLPYGDYSYSFVLKAIFGQ